MERAKGSESLFLQPVYIDAHLAQNFTLARPAIIMQSSPDCEIRRLASPTALSLPDTIAFSRARCPETQKRGALGRGGLKSLLAASSSSIQTFTAATASLTTQPRWTDGTLAALGGGCRRSLGRH